MDITMRRLARLGGASRAEPKRWRTTSVVLALVLLTTPTLPACEDEAECTDADGDGFGPTCRTGTDCDDTDASRYHATFGYADADGDGRTVAQPTELCIGALFPEEAYAPIATRADCDDANPDIFQLLTVFVDTDGDGFGAGTGELRCAGTRPSIGFAQAGGDCDDTDSTAHRTLLGYLDADNDGAGAGAQMTVCAGENLPAGYAERGDDCDDGNPLLFRTVTAYPDADGSGYGGTEGEPVCAGVELPPGFAGVAGDCDDAEVALYQVLRGYLDNDGDGFGAGEVMSVCSGVGLPEGYSDVNTDCDDTDPTAYRAVLGYADDDGDGVGGGEQAAFCGASGLPEGVAGTGGDCDDADPAVYRLLEGHLDSDGDGFGSGEAMQVCSGESLAEGYGSFGADCDETDPAAYQLVTAYIDLDGDGFGTGAAITVCAGETLGEGLASANGDCDDTDDEVFRLIPGYVDDDEDGFGDGDEEDICSGASLPTGYAAIDGDCDDDDEDVYRLISGFGDGDGDGFGAGDEDEICSGEALPEGFAPVGGDCDDANSAVYRALDGFTDADGDGYGTGERQDVCSGASLPEGFAPIDGDCADGDEAVFQELTGFLDEDLDGVGTGEAMVVCSGHALPDGYAAQVGDCSDEDFYNDQSCDTCNDDDEDDFFAFCDRYDEFQDGPDCDPLNALAWRVIDAFRDRDGDGYTHPEAKKMCVGDEPPEGFVEAPGEGDPPLMDDCNDWAPVFSQEITVFQDVDGDGYTVGPAETLCVGEDDDLLGLLDFFTDESMGEDCNDYLPDELGGPVFQLLTGYADRDGDGFTAGEAMQVCSGDELPDGYLDTQTEEDCDDLDPTTFPGADDPPGDLADQNCDGVSPLPTTDEEGIYVSAANGDDDTGLGTRESPVATVTRGIELAEGGGFDSVFIEGGEYEEEPTLTTSVSVYGGFRKGFAVQDLTVPTVLELGSTITGFRTQISSELTLAGLTMRAGADLLFDNLATTTMRQCDLAVGLPGAGAAVHNTGMLLVIDSAIAALGDQAADRIGLLNNGGTVTLVRSTIDGEGDDFVALFNDGTAIAWQNRITGSGTPDDLSGIATAVVNRGVAMLAENVIDGGCGEDQSTGIRNTETATAWIRDNAIHGGCTSATGIFNEGLVIVSGNTILGGGKGFGIGIFNADLALITGNPSVTGGVFSDDEEPVAPDFAIGVSNEGTAVIAANGISGGVGGDVSGIETVGGLTLAFENRIEGGVLAGGGGEALGVRALSAETYLVGNEIAGAGPSGCCGAHIGVAGRGDEAMVLLANTITGGGGEANVAAGVDVGAGEFLILYNDVEGGSGEGVFGIHVGDPLGPDGCDPPPDLRIWGNTIRGGDAFGVGPTAGVFIEDAFATITQNRITGGSGLNVAGVTGSGDIPISDNDITGGSSSDGFAYGILWFSGNPAIVGNTIEGGSAALQAGGILAIGLSSLVIAENTITGGRALALGPEINSAAGVIAEIEGLAVVTANVIFAGSAPDGATSGLGIAGGEWMVTDNLISGGDAAAFLSAGVVQDASATAFLTNNTIHGGRSFQTAEEAVGAFGFVLQGAPILPGGENPTPISWLINNIIDPGLADNVGVAASVLALNPRDSALVMRNNLLWGDRMTHLLVTGSFEISDSFPIFDLLEFFDQVGDVDDCLWSGCADAGDNLSADPLVGNAWELDFYLRAGSPAIDAGVDPEPDAPLPVLDIEWDPRPFGAAPDIGADEWVGELE